MSTTDPDAAPMRRFTGDVPILGYHDHYVVDGGTARTILAALVTPADVMDNAPLLDLFHPETVVLKNSVTGELSEMHPAGVFVFIGLSPNTALLKEVVDLDPRGFVATDATLMTSVRGIFAAGDCREGSTKPAASAAGEGAAAALSIRCYVERLSSGIPSLDTIEREMRDMMAAAG